MSEKHTDVTKLRAAILARFPRTPRPEDLFLPMDEFEDIESMERVFGKRNWWELTATRIEKTDGNSGAISREAFLYYLPAFLLAAIDERDGVIGTYSRLEPNLWSDNPGFAHWARPQLTPEQRDVIHMFASYLYKHFPDRFQHEYRKEMLAFWS